MSVQDITLETRIEIRSVHQPQHDVALDVIWRFLDEHAFAREIEFQDIQFQETSELYGHSELRAAYTLSLSDALGLRLPRLVLAQSLAAQTDQACDEAFIGEVLDHLCDLERVWQDRQARKAEQWREQLRAHGIDHDAARTE